MQGPIIAGITAVATLGGGCFWCLEAVFERIEGVVDVVSGYAGGTKADPTYEEVCTGTTGHAEVVQVTFDPKRISYAGLLEVLFKAHDPTTLNRQGADVGSQYRSIILYDGDEQRKAAEAARKKAQKNWKDPVVTEIVPLTAFYRAEDYHQDYFANNRSAGYCRVIIAPKLKKLDLAF
ncbi:MAG: peptide-methionine (S)-S-oxide reductase MsrA [Spirochaetes bacterium]|jgi:peptide-methionine (S)-S-oxide reductase|nr:peptide-methionine (S)-S-oxide reductase MsrA [Spirochaetota bacterium]